MNENQTATIDLCTLATVQGGYGASWVPMGTFGLDGGIWQRSQPIQEGLHTSPLPLPPGPGIR